ncbi:MAG: hydroxyethylthiazole kinase [Candidatus Altiarchaeota archaeon]
MAAKSRMLLDAYGMLERIRLRKPLVHHITNWVTIYDCANITRTFGALPVMAHAREEVQEMVALAGALVLNIGTLTPELIDTMVLAGKAANKKGIPVVLDAVGAGATRLRTDSVLRMLKAFRIDVLKGNFGEVGVIAGAKAEVRGVESMGLDGDPVRLAKGLSSKLMNTVVMTGKMDIVSGGGRTYLIDNGTAQMGSIVGTGCMAASVIGAFCAVEKDYPMASASALACYGIAGELAAKEAKGPGSFKEGFYDAVASLDRRHVDSMAKVSEK